MCHQSRVIASHHSHHPRASQRFAAKNFDRALWTTADYAVQISGLDRDVYADGPSGLKERVYADLMRLLQVKREQIVQVEIGRPCAPEVSELRKLKILKVREQELKARRREQREAGGSSEGATDKMRTELNKVKAAKEEVRSQPLLPALATHAHSRYHAQAPAAAAAHAHSWLSRAEGGTGGEALGEAATRPRQDDGSCVRRLPLRRQPQEFD